MSLDSDVRRFVQTIFKNASEYQRAICLEVGKVLIFESPVDEGRFRANWQFSIGNEDLTTTEKLDKDGSETYGRLKASINGVEVGQKFFITNNLPYAVPLEFGHSEKAQNGLIRYAAELLPVILQEAASNAE